MNRVRTVMECLKHIVDEGSFKETQEKTTFRDPLQWRFGVSYREKYDSAVSSTAHTCGVTWGVCTINGLKTIIIINDFNFLGGSLATAEAEATVHAFDAAIGQHLPVLWCLASGGCRFYEGIHSLHCISAIINARTRLSKACIPLICIAMHPLYGGMNVCASLADITIGEKDAHIGFTGVNVIKSFERYPLPPGFQTSEYVFSHGHIDAVVTIDEMKHCIAQILTILYAPHAGDAVIHHEFPFGVDVLPIDAWKAVHYSRHEKWSIPQLIELIFDKFYELHGDRHSADDSAIRSGIGSIGKRTFVVIGHRNRSAGETGFPFPQNCCSSHPAGHRKALRMVRLAEKLHIPVVTFIDTPGAYPDVNSEAEGMTGTIGELIAAMLELDVPSVGFIIGEGGSAGALPFATVDRLIMCDYATYSVISPEMAAMLVAQDVEKAPDAAAALKLTSTEMLHAGIIDYVLQTDLTQEQLAISMKSGILQCIEQIESENVDRTKRIRITL